MFPAIFSMLAMRTELKLAYRVGTMPNCEYLAGSLHRGCYDRLHRKKKVLLNEMGRMAQCCFEAFDVALELSKDSAKKKVMLLKMKS